MKFFTLLPLLALASARELQIVNTSSGSSEVSEAFKKAGYTSEHTAECIIELVGTQARVAAGDRDMSLISKYFKKHLKKTLKKLGNGPIEATQRTLLEGAENQTPKIKVTSTEVTKQIVNENEQQIGEQLNGGARGRELQTWGNGFFFSYNNYACLYCGLDDGDRRHLQEALDEDMLLEGFEKDLRKQTRPFFVDALERGNGCIKISCDGGPTVGTAGCLGIDSAR